MQKDLKNLVINPDDAIKFYLNSDLIELNNLGASDTLLDFLRDVCSLTGSKEGCGEGDCGACTVLLGRVEAGKLAYKSINACICLMPSLNASHIVTVESLRFFDGRLHPIQQSMVNNHGSQCGFCTPGIVMSLYGAWLKSIEPSHGNIEKSLQGNLCRCTGYGPIIEAAKSISQFGKVEDDKLITNEAAMRNNLIELDFSNQSIGISESSKFIVPNSLLNLCELFIEYPEATIVAGATDVGLWITKALASINLIIFIGNLKELKEIKELQERIEFGSCVTYSDFEPIFCKHFPIAADYFSRIAGEQIRNVGTIGGNIGNGSPIGDLAPLFIALNASMVLRKGSDTREIEIEDFFIDYGIQDIKKSEFIEKICIPLYKHLFLFPYKISKRRDEDISTISAIFAFKVLNGKLSKVRLVFGGMAATPKRARNTENILEGKVFDSGIVKLAQKALETDFTPIGDMRASSNYRMQVGKNLLQKCQLEYSLGSAIKLIRDV